MKIKQIQDEESLIKKLQTYKSYSWGITTGNQGVSPRWSWLCQVNDHNGDVYAKVSGYTKTSREALLKIIRVIENSETAKRYKL